MTVQNEYNFDLSNRVESISDGKFNAVIYNGGVLTDHPSFPNGVIFDLSKTATPEKLPVLLNHDTDRPVGFSLSIAIENQSIKADGQLLENQHGKEIKSLHEQGFSWQLSPRIKAGNIRVTKSKETINGIEVSAGVTVFENNRLREFSFTPVGVDGTTSAQIFAIQDLSTIQPTPEATMKNVQQEVASELLERLRYMLNLPALATADDIFAELDKLKNLVTTSQQAAQEAAMSLREIELQQVFGASYDKAKHEHYFSLDKTTFDAIKTDLKPVAKADAPEHLFSLGNGEKPKPETQKTFNPVEAINAYNQQGKH